MGLNDLSLFTVLGYQLREKIIEFYALQGVIYMNKVTKKKNCLYYYIGSALITAVGIFVVPWIINKCADKLYKFTLPKSNISCFK